jgi:Carbamoylphosphate synthase large subunit (split gene in MJ)
MSTILFTSIGRRVQLTTHFLLNGWTVFGTDINPENCATRRILRQIYRAPEFQDTDDYYNFFFELCRQHDVKYLVPLYEPEFMGLSRRKRLFQKAGIQIVLSDETSLRCCLDKYRLSVFFREHGILTPETRDTPSELDNHSEWIVKPRSGMGSKNVHRTSRVDAEFYFNKVHNPIIQRYIEGEEYSIDVYVSENGQVLSVVPRIRLEVRSGEVSKSMTTNDHQITELTLKLLKHLRLFGPATIQGIKEAVSEKFYFIEVNPRFGGGVPLSMQAGIPYADFIGGKYFVPPGTLHAFQHGLKMLRYDEAIFVTDRD